MLIAVALQIGQGGLESLGRRAGARTERDGQRKSAFEGTSRRRSNIPNKKPVNGTY